MTQRYENGKGNLHLETHIKKANRKTQDMLGDDVRKDIQKLLPHTRQQLEYRIDVCCVIRGAHIEHL